MKISNLEKYPVLIGFVGVLLGAVIVGFYQNKLYESQRFDRYIEKKEQILEEAYRVYSRMPEIQYWQKEVIITAVDSITAMDKLNSFKKEQNEIVAKQYSNYLAVNKMIELYFGEDSKNLVRKAVMSHADWWNIPNGQLRAITDAMSQEIKNEIKDNH